MKKKIISGGILTVVVLAIVFFCILKLQPENNRTVPLSGTLVSKTGERIDVRIVDTYRTRELGLSFFKELPEHEGMLFLFDHPARNDFWMKDMQFPLDIVWLRKESPTNYRVVFRKQNLSPATYPLSFGPEFSTDAVLEINALKSDDFGITEGTLLGLTSYK